ncbi:Chondroitin sulfate synthase 3 [Geodia barretti]|nr:Chondroitin sulfate synthase 3 [Geodia barretti]
MQRQRLLSCVLLFAALSFVATQEPVGICGLDGFNLNDLHFGQYWNFTAPDPANDCLYEIDPDNITSCVVYFAVCKPLPSSICGSENGNASYCQVVTAKDGTIYRYNVGNYSQSHKFSRLDDGFSSVRHGYKYENDRLCKNSTTASITNFECDPDAKFSTSESDITQYLKSTERIPNAECFITTTIGYSGACYQQPTLAPAHCSLTGFDTTAISEQDYFYADVPDGICYNFDEGEPCILLFAFCHPLPLDLSDNCRNPESAICQADKLADATKSWSMGAYENYTRFYENVDFDQVGFHVLYSDGSNPGDPDCTAGIQTRVIFVCNKDAQWTNRDVTFHVEVEKETCFFNIVAQYSGACYKAHDIDSSSHSDKTSIVGWILIGIFLFGVLTYLVIGSAIQYFIRGERGIRVLPNFDFWRKFALLTLKENNTRTKMGSSGSRNKPMRVRLATVLPFTTGVFLGTLMTLFLVLTLRSIDEETGYRKDERTGVVVMPSSPRRLPPRKTRDPQSNEDAARHREFMMYSVVVGRSELRTRGLAAHKTWASSLGRRVSFYLHPPGGHLVLPEGRDREELGLREGEGYCMEMGYVLSSGALGSVCPHLEQCWENARSENEDVEVARCVRLATGINCTSSQESKQLFYKARGLLSEEELQLGQHHLNPSLKRALLLSPLTQPEHFYHMHYYYVRGELNASRLAATQLRLHMIETADRAAESDNYAHTSVHQSPGWTRLGVNSPYRPRTAGDAIHCLSFDSEYRYTESKHYPSHHLSGVVATDLEEIVGAVARKYGTQNLPINSVLQRVDPQRGIDYFIHALEKNTDGEYNSRFMHALRETEPLQVTSVQPANYHTTKVNFVVPTAAVSKAFQRFMISFENTFLARTPPELVGLFVILYSDGKVKKYSKNLFATTTLLRLYKKKYPTADLRLVTTDRPFSRKQSIELASRENPSFELLFLADIHVDFSHQFLESPYNPSEFYKDRLLHPYAVRFKIAAEQGSWMDENFHLACLYNYDLARVLEGGRDLKERDWSLIDLVMKQSGLRVFRGVEPGLVNLWQDGCTEDTLSGREKVLCEKLGLTGKDD